jgi:hypothetical protein
MADRLFLEFHTTAGHTLEFFPGDQLLRVAKRVVLQSLKFDVSTADEFVVTLDGMLLDETKTLSALGIGDVAVLFIERRGNSGFQDPPSAAPNS